MGSNRKHFVDKKKVRVGLCRGYNEKYKVDICTCRTDERVFSVTYTGDKARSVLLTFKFYNVAGQRLYSVAAKASFGAALDGFIGADTVFVQKLCGVKTANAL